MGGCKCTFRNCPNNSSNSPDKHFFHYPVKDLERFKKWTKFANTEIFLELPIPKARNKAVCEVHFRDDFFMNYKKDRLVHYAIPTLVPLPNNLCLDYEDSDQPEPKPLPTVKQSHLISPEAKRRKLEQNNTSQHVVHISSFNDSDDKSIQILNDLPLSLPSQPKLRKTMVSKLPPKILNSTLKLNQKDVFIPNCSKNSMQNQKIHDNVNISLDGQTIFHLEEFELNSKNIVENSDNIIIEEYSKIEDKLITHSSEDDGNCQNTCEKIINDVENKATQTDNEIYNKLMYYQQQMEEKDKFIEQLQNQLIQEKEANCKMNLALEEAKKKLSTIKQAEKITTKLPTLSSSVTHSATSRADIFNSVKKYLSSSMATLVRMEMFGSPDREWKTDEKQISTEILQLGVEVFKYMRDEWRFRLPPLKSVEKWLNNTGNMDD